MRDTQLYAVLTNAGNAYLAQDFRTGPHGTVIPEPLIEPFARLTNRIAPAWFEPEDDGVVRSVALKYSDGLRREYPTLAALAAGYRTTDLAELPERIRLRFRATPEALFPSINAETLVPSTNTTAPSHLESLVNSNTVVVVGRFYEAASDQFAAPGAVAGQSGTLAGAHLLAYTLDTLAQRPWPQRMSPWLEALLSVAFILVGYRLANREPRRGKWWMNIAPPAAYLIASFIAARGGSVWPIPLVLGGWVLGFCTGRVSHPDAANALRQNRGDRRKDRPRRGSVPRT
jgi:CHASE2 domain-containing sensor protein